MSQAYTFTMKWRETNLTFVSNISIINYKILKKSPLPTKRFKLVKISPSYPLVMHSQSEHRIYFILHVCRANLKRSLNKHTVNLLNKECLHQFIYLFFKNLSAVMQYFTPIFARKGISLSSSYFSD